MMVASLIAATLSSPLPAGERSTRIVRCAAGEGPLRESECVERPLTRSLRFAPASTSPLRGEVNSWLAENLVQRGSIGGVNQLRMRLAQCLHHNAGVDFQNPPAVIDLNDVDRS